MDIRRVLILGGTGEARQLAERLAAQTRLDIVVSLAGRTKNPTPQAGRVRTGGFGGADGLARFIAQEGVDIVVDATHPFADRISQNAAIAVARSDVPLVVLERKPWMPAPGDDWIDAGDVADAVRQLGKVARNVFVAVGRLELAPFAASPQHRYLIRSVDPVDPAPDLPRARYLLARGPFDEREEAALLRRHGIDIVVAKNSGGAATYAKIAAARALAIPVVMIRRPRDPAHEAVHTVDDAVARIGHLAPRSAPRGE